MGVVGGGFLWPVLWTVLITLVVLAVVYVIWTRTTVSGERPDRAMALLRERYARGAISDEEFDERRSRLLGDRWVGDENGHSPHR